MLLLKALKPICGTMSKENIFTFKISLSVLNHLGRNLYRSFITVLGEAISNAWDADADNVWIYIDKEKNNFVIKDDGIGMSGDDFQKKFLKIGYSKRKDGQTTSEKGRPYIGRKGIGKLALLSCADTITVISKIKNHDYVGGVIDNSSLDDAITEDLDPQEYQLGEWKREIFNKFTKKHDRGTIIHFENLKEGIRNTLDYLKKIVALYFKFSLIDDSFNIFIDDEKITLDHLTDFAEKTEYVWNINGLVDPYINEKLTKLKEEMKHLSAEGSLFGFIASVEKPSNLKIRSTDERITVDLFVNGRLREKDILKHIPTTRVVESYLYGQIHFNGLDDNEDRFTSSREGIISNDPKYKEFLAELKKMLSAIFDDWDIWRSKHKQDGDPENKRLTKKQRKSHELFNAVSEEFGLPVSSENRRKVDGWVTDLSDDAAFNFQSYAECFLSENLVRKYIYERNLPISSIAKTEIGEWKDREIIYKQEGNINIEIRRNNDDLSYLDMPYLVRQADTAGIQNTLLNDAKEYRPIRNAIMHTAMLTLEAKRKLTAVYENIKGRIITLLSDAKTKP